MTNSEQIPPILLRLKQIIQAGIDTQKSYRKNREIAFHSAADNFIFQMLPQNNLYRRRYEKVIEFSKDIPLRGLEDKNEILHNLYLDAIAGMIEFSEPMANTVEMLNVEPFFSLKRLEELKEISHPNYDLTQLIKVCEELNLNYYLGNYYAVGMLGRAVLDHVPPIFSQSKFVQVASQINGKSIRQSLTRLQEAFRPIVDGYLHNHAGKKSVLPERQQIDFKPEFDVLLQEIVRILG